MKPRKPIRKRSLAKSLIEKAKRKAEEAWKAACHRRDRSTCQICKGKKADGYVIQIDHCFSRSTKQLFYNPKNGTALCAGCHTLKTFHVKGMEKRVDDFVRRREGQVWWDWAMQEAQKSGAVKFYLEELETIKTELDGMFL